MRTCMKTMIRMRKGMTKMRRKRKGEKQAQNTGEKRLSGKQ